MIASVLLMAKFGFDIAQRLIEDAYFRALGILLLMMVVIGTLFIWLVEGRPFIQAPAYSAGTLAMNSPYGFGWGPTTTGGVIFNIIYIFLGVGLFLNFVLEAGKTMVGSYDDFTTKFAERRARKRAAMNAVSNS